jgi:hypothetical protein
MMAEKIGFGRISGLVTQVWLSVLAPIEQHGKTISQVWHGQVLRLTFKRSVSERLMDMWYDLLGIVETLNLQDENDQIVWSFNSNGKFSVQSLYAVFNHRGILFMTI